jgi:hypothetical protein
VGHAHPGAPHRGSAHRGYYPKPGAALLEPLVKGKELPLVQFYDGVLVHRELPQAPDGVGNRAVNAQEFPDDNIHPGLAFLKGLYPLAGLQLLPHLGRSEIFPLGGLYLVYDLCNGDLGWL